MSTQPIERRHLRPVARRRFDGRRVAMIAALFAGTFGIAFLVGHTHAGSATGERLPPSLPSVPTPVSASLQSAPAIATGVVQPPPVKHSSHASAAPSVSAPVEPVLPAVSSEPVTPAVTHVETPAPSTPVEPSKPAAPAPTPSSSGSGSHSSGSGSSGTSFESSG